MDHDGLNIGIKFHWHQNGEVRIEEVVKGGPAHKALLPPRVGDQLVRVGGKMVPALISRHELTHLILRSAALGSSVSLTLRNDTLQEEYTSILHLGSQPTTASVERSRGLGRQEQVSQQQMSRYQRGPQRPASRVSAFETSIGDSSSYDSLPYNHSSFQSPTHDTSPFKRFPRDDARPEGMNLHSVATEPSVLGDSVRSQFRSPLNESLSHRSDWQTFNAAQHHNGYHQQTPTRPSAHQSLNRKNGVGQFESRMHAHLRKEHVNEGVEEDWEERARAAEERAERAEREASVLMEELQALQEHAFARVQATMTDLAIESQRSQETISLLRAENQALRMQLLPPQRNTNTISQHASQQLGVSGGMEDASRRPVGHFGAGQDHGGDVSGRACAVVMEDGRSVQIDPFSGRVFDELGDISALELL